MFVFQDTAQQGSFRFPDSCTSSADCDFLVNYQTSGEDKVVFEISGKNNWAGVGFSDDNLMVNNHNVAIMIIILNITEIS